MKLVQVLEDVAAAHGLRHSQKAGPPGPAHAAVGEALRHQRRVWGLVNALWGKVGVPASTPPPPNFLSSLPLLSPMLPLFRFPVVD